MDIFSDNESREPLSSIEERKSEYDASISDFGGIKSREVPVYNGKGLTKFLVKF